MKDFLFKQFASVDATLIWLRAHGHPPRVNVISRVQRDAASDA